jgi:hypothetical protein
MRVRLESQSQRTILRVRSTTEAKEAVAEAMVPSRCFSALWTSPYESAVCAACLAAHACCAKG